LLLLSACTPHHTNTHTTTQAQFINVSTAFPLPANTLDNCEQFNSKVVFGLKQVCGAPIRVAASAR
jgi:hypothetical protein